MTKRKLKKDLEAEITALQAQLANAESILIDIALEKVFDTQTAADIVLRKNGYIGLAVCDNCPDDRMYFGTFPGVKVTEYERMK